jgi:hypothetical protein
MEVSCEAKARVENAHPISIDVPRRKFLRFTAFSF